MALYTGMAGSPITYLTEAMTAEQTTATVSDGTALPEAPNLCTIGFGEYIETMEVETKMDYEKILQRIGELEEMEFNMNALSSQKRLELAQKEAEAAEIRKVINANNFVNTEEYKELQELRITKKWLEK